VGWLQPSLVITSQEIPAGGYPQPQVGFLTLWWLDFLIVSLYTIGGVFFVVTNRKKTRFLLLIPGFVAIVAGIILHNKGLLRSNLLLVIGILILAVGVYYSIQRPTPNPQNRS
jgi:hypothetical protein